MHVISFLRLNLHNCKDLFLSADVPVKKLKHILNDKTSTGEIDIGTLVVPQTFEKTSVKSNDVVTEKLQIEGRKIKLFNIRRKTFESQKSTWDFTLMIKCSWHTLMQLLRKRKYLSQEAGKGHTITHLKEKFKK